MTATTSEQSLGYTALIEGAMDLASDARIGFPTPPTYLTRERADLYVLQVGIDLKRAAQAQFRAALEQVDRDPEAAVAAASLASLALHSLTALERLAARYLG